VLDIIQGQNRGLGQVQGPFVFLVHARDGTLAQRRGRVRQVPGAGSGPCNSKNRAQDQGLTQCLIIIVMYT